MKLTKPQSDTLDWLRRHIKSERLTLTELSRKLPRSISKGSLSQLLNEIYPSPPGDLIDVIEGYRKSEIARGQQRPFVLTSIAKKVTQFCRLSQKNRLPVSIYGDSQTGKTHTLRHIHREAIMTGAFPCYYFRPPGIGGGKTMLMGELNRALNLPQSPRRAVLSTFLDQQRAAIEPGSLFLFDELHELFLTYSEKVAIAFLEHLRYLHDEAKAANRGFGLVMVGTNVFRDKLTLGKHRAVLNQLVQRSIHELQLPSNITKSDVNLFADQYGLPPITGRDNQHAKFPMDILADHSLARLLHYMDQGAKLAKTQGKKMTWKHVILSHDSIDHLSQN